MAPMASSLVRPANVVVAIAVGLALLRLLMGRRRPAPAGTLARAAALAQSVAGEEDPGAAWEELRTEGRAPTLH